MQKILVPANDDILSEEFLKCDYYRIYHVSKNVVRKEESINTSKLRSESLPAWISKKKITDVIADKIEFEILDKINRSKINVFVGIKPKSTIQIIDDLMKGTLETVNSTIL